MKLRLISAGLAACLLAACAHPLETVAQQRNQERIDASNADQPLSNGAGDGLGKSFARSQASLSLRNAMQAP